MATLIVDAGPLVAMLNSRDAHHAWAKETFARLRAPFLTCEAVLTETLFLVGRSVAARNAVFDLVRRRALNVEFALAEHLDVVERLMAKYASVPMSLADGCLVRMSEAAADAVVITLDRDFLVYRRHGNKRLALIAPWAD